MGVLVVKRDAEQRVGLRLPDGRWAFVHWHPQAVGISDVRLVINAPSDVLVIREELIGTPPKAKQGGRRCGG